MVKKAALKYIVSAVIALLILVYWLVNVNNLSSNHNSTSVLNRLERSVNHCEGVAVKSVAHLSAFLEFQRLEIEGRKMYVFERCMRDQGFIENPAWVKFAEPISQKDAEVSGVSINEAYEKFRRKQMINTKVSSNNPLYWIPIKLAKSN